MAVKKIIYVSALSSNSYIEGQYKITGKNPGFAVQKFSRLLVKGLSANGASVSALSNPPVLNAKHFSRSHIEYEDGIKYQYVPCINFPILKHICVFIYSFFYILFWGCGHRREKTIICDVLSISICMGALLASKFNGVQCVAVVTDIYGLMVSVGRKNIKSRIAEKLNSLYIGAFDKYILLTEQMNEIVNPQHRPYMLMEALCDSSICNKTINEPIIKAHPRLVVYAGGIFEKYGLKMLAEAFIKANVKDAKLVYYGDGSYVEEYKSLCNQHSNLEYRGVASNEEIVSVEQTAALLVNPRFSSEEFTKYSFPSKNMEYMASGTPLLTTKLPGMPIEYYPYVLLLKEETVDGYAAALRSTLARQESELCEIGAAAKEFVLNNKNNVAQGRRIIAFISK